MERPKTQYARSGDLAIAYQVHGAGEHDILFGSGPFANVGTVLDYLPEAERLFDRLGRFARVIRYDRRDAGLSDPIRDDLALDAHAQDALAVLDAVGAERPFLVGGLDGCRGLALLAAMHPERVSGLLAIAPTVRSLAATAPEAAVDFARELGRLHWPDLLVQLSAPEWSADPVRRDRLTRYFATCATPRQAERTLRMESDVGDALGLVQAPTLVLHPEEVEVVPREAVKAFADGIPGAEFRLVPGASPFLYALDVDMLADVIEEFVTGTAPAPVVNRVLATVLFTDLVGSTEKAAEVGDRAWARTLGHHLDRARAAVTAFDGRVIKTTGDGVLALFTGPANGVRAAERIVEESEPLGLQVRAGVHTGEVERTDDDVAGLCVHLAARIMASARPSEVLVSRTVRDLVIGSQLEFTDRGEHELKGIPDRWTLYAAA